MHIAMATDTAYLPWCATAMLSVLRTTGAAHLHVLHEGGLATADRDRLDGMVRDAGGDLTYWPIDSHDSWFPSKGPALGGRASWLRVLLPDLLGDLDRVVYLDADTFAVDSLAALWDAPLAGAPIAAVPNVVEVSSHGHVVDLGIADPHRYFNAGVLVMNLATMRAERMLESVRAFVDEQGTTLWFDQDALNVVYADRWFDLDQRWNAQNSFWYWPELADEVLGTAARQRATDAPGILHFEGPAFVKPWHFLCRHPYRQAYRAMLRDTPWRDAALEERTLVTRMIRLLPSTAQWPAYTHWQRARRRKTPVAS